MPGTMSQATSQRYERHQKTVERLDEELQTFNLRLLLSLPEHKSVLTTVTRTRGIDFGIKSARKTLQALKEGSIIPQDVLNFITRKGFNILK